MSRGGQAICELFHTRHLLQFSSSLPSGQSLKPLQRKRPMMQWTPLAHVKNVGAHFDLNLAGERWRVGEYITIIHIYAGFLYLANLHFFPLNDLIKSWNPFIYSINASKKCMNCFIIGITVNYFLSFVPFWRSLKWDVWRISVLRLCATEQRH